MSRVKENQEVIDAINEQTIKTNVESTEELMCFDLAAIGVLLTDISKSLAIIADKAESEGKE